MPLSSLPSKLSAFSPPSARPPSLESAPHPAPSPVPPTHPSKLIALYPPPPSPPFDSICDLLLLVLLRLCLPPRPSPLLFVSQTLDPQCAARHPSPRGCLRHYLCAPSRFAVAARLVAAACARAAHRAMQSPQPRSRALWREGGLRRVGRGAAAGFAGGVLYATARALPPASAARAGIACALLAAPFFGLREVVAAGAGVDGPVASAIAGGLGGYFGALAVSGPHWKTLSHSAMVFGMGCGLVDAVATGLDWRRKVWLVNRGDARVEGERGEGQVTGQVPAAWAWWPVWFPVLKKIDHEYHELLERQKATVIALEEEQARIALLLEALQSVKAGKRVRDIELADCDFRSSSEEGRSHGGSPALTPPVSPPPANDRA